MWCVCACVCVRACARAPQIETGDIDSHEIELHRYVPRILIEYCIRTAISQNGIVKQKVRRCKFPPLASSVFLGSLARGAAQMDVSNVNPAYLMAVKSSTGGGAFEFSNKKRKSSVTQRTLRIVGSIQVTRYTRSGIVLNDPDPISKSVPSTCLVVLRRLRVDKSDCDCCCRDRRGSCPFGVASGASIPTGHPAIRRGSEDRGHSSSMEDEEGKGLLDNDSDASGSGNGSGSDADDDDEESLENVDRLVVLSWTKSDVVEEEEMDARSRRRSMESSLEMAQSRRAFDNGSVGSSVQSPRDGEGSDDDEMGGGGGGGRSGFSIPVNPSYSEGKSKVRPEPHVHALLCEDGEDGNGKSETATSTTDANSSAMIAADDASSDQEGKEGFAGNTAITVSKRITGMNVSAVSERTLKSNQSRSKSIAAATARVCCIA